MHVYTQAHTRVHTCTRSHAYTGTGTHTHSPIYACSCRVHNQAKGPPHLQTAPCTHLAGQLKLDPVTSVLLFQAKPPFPSFWPPLRSPLGPQPFSPLQVEAALPTVLPRAPTRPLTLQPHRKDRFHQTPGAPLCIAWLGTDRGDSYEVALVLKLRS